MYFFHIELIFEYRGHLVVNFYCFGAGQQYEHPSQVTPELSPEQLFP